jgi:hypothetical protein
VSLAKATRRRPRGPRRRRHHPFGIHWAALVGGIVGGAAVMVLGRIVWPERGDRPRLDGPVLLLGTLTGVVVSGASLRIAPHDPALALGVQLVLFAVVVAALADVTARDRLGLVPVLLAVTVAGQVLCLPDTEQVTALAGAAGVLAAAALVEWAAGARPSVHAAAVSGGIGGMAMCWCIGHGGAGRAGSVVGAVACGGVLLVEPIVRRLSPRDRRSPSATIALVVVQIPVVLWCSRVAGLRRSAGEAAVLAAPALLAAAMVVWLLGRRQSAPTVPQ